MYQQHSLTEFLDQLASASPTPGGGSAAAVMGSMGAALVSMVANLTIGKPGYQEVEPQMRELLERSEALRQRLLAAIDDDIAAFNQVMAAYRLPKDDPERGGKIQTALKSATDAPLACARLCGEVIGLCQTAAESGNVNVISDAGVGVLAAQAALKSCAINVIVNLNAIRDRAFVEDRRRLLDDLLNGKDHEVETLYQLVLKKL